MTSPKIPCFWILIHILCDDLLSDGIHSKPKPRCNDFVCRNFTCKILVNLSRPCWVSSIKCISSILNFVNCKRSCSACTYCYLCKSFFMLLCSLFQLCRRFVMNGCCWPRELSLHPQCTYNSGYILLYKSWLRWNNKNSTTTVGHP